MTLGDGFSNVHKAFLFFYAVGLFNSKPVKMEAQPGEQLENLLV